MPIAVGITKGRSASVATSRPSNAPSTEIADDLTKLKLGVRQRWQTKRGLPGRERIVDLLQLDLDLLAALQDGLPLVARPYARIAAELGVGEDRASIEFGEVIRYSHHTV